MGKMGLVVAAVFPIAKYTKDLLGKTVFFLCVQKIVLNRYCPECSATGMGQFPICKLKWDLLRTSVTACTIDKDTFSAPFGTFYVTTEF